MRGENGLRLNQATLKGAVQEYLDKRLVGVKVEVVSVEETGQRSGEFRVLIRELVPEVTTEVKKS